MSSHSGVSEIDRASPLCIFLLKIKTRRRFYQIRAVFTHASRRSCVRPSIETCVNVKHYGDEYVFSVPLGKRYRVPARSLQFVFVAVAAPHLGLTLRMRRWN